MVWIPGIPLWKGLLRRGTLRIPNQQLTIISWLLTFKDNFKLHSIQVGDTIINQCLRMGIQGYPTNVTPTLSLSSWKFQALGTCRKFPWISRLFDLETTDIYHFKLALRKKHSKFHCLYLFDKLAVPPKESERVEGKSKPKPTEWRSCDEALPKLSAHLMNT